MDKQSEEIKAIMKRYSDIIGERQIFYRLRIFSFTKTLYHTVSSCYITIIYVSEDEDFDVEEEDVRRIVRKSLEPDHETAYPDDDEGNETEFPDSSEIFTNQEKTQIDDEDMEFNQMIDAAIEEIRNFVPKRKRKDNPMFLDLAVEDEKKIRTKNKGAPYYWHMPFRHTLFLKALTNFEEKRISSDEDQSNSVVSKDIMDPNKT